MLNDDLIVAVSCVADGSMSAGVEPSEKLHNRKTFLSRNGIEIDTTTLVYVRYEGQDYCRYRTIDNSKAGAGMTNSTELVSDALFTREEGLALFLPIADCIGAVLYDPEQTIVGVSHLGRHNLEQDGAAKTIRYMVRNFGSDPARIEVWLSPSAGKAAYPLYDFDNHSLAEVATEQLLSAGINTDNIAQDFRDTTTDQSLFSHSQFLRGEQAIDGRQAVVAMMRYS